MPFRAIALTVLVLFAAAFGWRYRHAEWLQGVFSPPVATKAKPIVFDNGTVRTPPPPASGPMPAAIGMRKCLRGTTVSYTDQPCPPGSREAPVNRGVVTVVEATAPAPAPAPAPAAKPSAGPLLPNARDAIRPAGPSLNEQAIERATR
jgi:hypothetical protein